MAERPNCYNNLHINPFNIKRYFLLNLHSKRRCVTLRQIYNIPLSMIFLKLIS
jgi:hypothetical protein